MFPSDKFTFEEAMEAWAQTEAEEKARRAPARKRARSVEEKRTAGTEEGTSPPMRVRTLQPPHPGASITLEQAIQAWAETEAEEKALRASKRKTVRAAPAGARRGGGKAAGGG
jgi:hypothetical protein